MGRTDTAPLDGKRRARSRAEAPDRGSGMHRMSRRAAGRRKAVIGRLARDLPRDDRHSLHHQAIGPRHDLRGDIQSLARGKRGDHALVIPLARTVVKEFVRLRIDAQVT